MDRKSKYLIGLFLLVLAVAVGAEYRSLVVEKDFIVSDFVSCDPEQEICFDYCEDGECDGEPYAKIQKHASQLSQCKPYESEECEEQICEVGEQGCVITYCSEDNLEEGEICYVPEEEMEEEEEVDEEVEDSGEAGEVDESTDTE